MKKSLLIHTRASTSERQRNFNFAHHFNMANGIYSLFDEVIVGEFDTQPRVRTLPGVKKIFVLDSQDFSRSWTKNFLAKSADLSSSVLMFADDDFLFQREAILEVFGHLDISDEILGGAPFDLNRVYDTVLGEQVDFSPSGKTTRPDMCVGAGAIIVKRWAFEKVGGFNEDIIGWGLEDNTLEWALWRHGTLTATRHSAIHLSHDSSYRRQRASNLILFRQSINDANWDEREREKWPLKGMVEEDTSGLLLRPMLK